MMIPLSFVWDIGNTAYIALWVFQYIVCAFYVCLKWISYYLQSYVEKTKKTIKESTQKS